MAEMWTFVPVLTDVLGAPWDVDGPVKNAHVVATIAVYFNPAKTFGSMIEADWFTMIGVVYAMFLCCGSMGMSVLFDKYELQGIGHFLVVVVWLGGGFGLIAWVKLTSGKPAVATACSMVSLICSSVITKEGAFHVGRFQEYAILQVLLIVCVGSAISNCVCFCVWPTSATSKLQVDLNRTLSSFSTLLDLLTRTFLLEGEVKVRPETLQRAIDAHHASYTTLQNDLKQAKYEVLDSRISSTGDTYDEVVATMLQLSQGLAGMRAGCVLQQELMQTAIDDDTSLTTEKKRLKEEVAVVTRFKELVGASLLDLTRCSKRTLSLLRTSFARTKSGAAARQKNIQSDTEAADTNVRISDIKSELQQALKIFKREYSKAIRLLYRTLPPQTVYDAAQLDAQDPFGDSPPSEGGPNENLFRIYHFCFNLEEWATDLSTLVDSFETLRETEARVEHRKRALRQRFGPAAALLAVVSGLRDRFTLPRAKAHGSTKRPSSSNPFPPLLDGALTSHDINSTRRLSWVGRVKRSMWRFGAELRRSDIRFGIKTGAGAALLASAAFTSLRPIWLEWRGEWALISYMVIMAQSQGATNFLAFGRVVGTFAGGGVAILCYVLFPDNPIVLPLLGAIVSAPCFYVIVTRYGPSSRFVLLTYNLTCLYAYNLKQGGADTHPVSIAIHRSLAVAFGVVYGLIINTFVWPYEARRELRRELSDFFLNSAHLYLKMVSAYSSPPTAAVSANTEEASERSRLLTKHIDQSEREYVRMQLYLQQSLIKIGGLLGATAHEYRLKGPFPVAEYRLVLTSCQKLLDLLISMSNMTNREAWFTHARDYVEPVQRERRQMVGNVTLYLSLLASTLSLKQPMPPFLPPAAEARLVLVNKLRSLDIVKRRIVRGGADSLLYVGYVLVMRDVIEELDTLGAIFQHLFGIVGGSAGVEEFEALFRTRSDEEAASHFSGSETSSANGT